MKKIFAILCAASALIACNKNNDITPDEGDLNQEIVSFKFSIKQESADTKAKTGFESDDKVFVFFEGVPEKYVTLSYNGSEWTPTASTQLIRNDFSGKIKKLNAIHFPAFVGDVTVTYSAGAFSFTDRAGDYIYTYYMYAEDVDYEVSATEITAAITMSKPAGFVQFFVPETSESHGYRLLESHLQPKACTSVSLDGSINVDESIDPGYVVKGYRASNNGFDGTMFSCYVTSADVSTDYDFSLVTYISEAKPAALGTQTLSGTKTIKSGFIFNLPDPSGTWTALTPFVDLGYVGGPLWATGNLSTTGIVSPLEAGDYYKWCYTTPYDGTEEGEAYYADYYTGVYTTAKDPAYVKSSGAWAMPSKDQFEALMDPLNTTIDWVSDWTELGEWAIHGGAVFTSNTNGISLFLPAAGYYEGGYLESAGSYSAYYTSTPYDDENAYYLDKSDYADVAIEFCPRYYAFVVRPVMN